MTTFKNIVAFVVSFVISSTQKAYAFAQDFLKKYPVKDHPVPYSLACSSFVIVLGCMIVGDSSTDSIAKENKSQTPVVFAEVSSKIEEEFSRIKKEDKKPKGLFDSDSSPVLDLLAEANGIELERDVDFKKEEEDLSNSHKWYGRVENSKLENESYNLRKKNERKSGKKFKFSVLKDESKPVSADKIFETEFSKLELDLADFRIKMEEILISKGFRDTTEDRRRLNKEDVASGFNMGKDKHESIIFSRFNEDYELEIMCEYGMARGLVLTFRLPSEEEISDYLYIPLRDAFRGISFDDIEFFSPDIEGNVRAFCVGNVNNIKELPSRLRFLFKSLEETKK